jgi:site-specific recombinase XerD
MLLKNENTDFSLGRTSFQGESLSQLLPGFLLYAEYDLNFSKTTIKKYQECIKQVIRYGGDIGVTSLTQPIVTAVKQEIYSRGAGDARVASIMFALKSFLKYCHEELEMSVISYKKLKTPRRRRREVIYLTNNEVHQFLESIPIYHGWKGSKPGKYVYMDGLRFRTLTEVLLGTGIRISEALMLNRNSIDFEKAEAKIIGKGSKERTIFFTSRSLEWIKFYLKERSDNEQALFVGRNLNRLYTYDVSKYFRTYKLKSGVQKKITPHILRHTVATNLLFNGCPISHVKEILGHENLETTCKYYLGIDKTKAKEAHNTYLKYSL